MDLNVLIKYICISTSISTLQVLQPLLMAIHCKERCTKVSLDGLLRKTGSKATPLASEAVRRFREANRRLQDLLWETYHLMGIYFRYTAEKNIPQKAWKKELVHDFIKAVSTSETDRVGNETTFLRVLKELRKEYYDPLRQKNGCQPLLVCRDGLPAPVLEETVNHIVAEVLTNIREHYLQHQKNYVRLRDSVSGNKLSKKIQEINATGPGPTHDDSLPAEIKVSVESDLQDCPDKFLKPLYNMNKFFEERGMKKIAILPLGMGFVPGAVLHVNTDGLYQLMKSSAYEASAEMKSMIKYALLPYEKAQEERRQAESNNREQLRAAGENVTERTFGRRADIPMLDEKDMLWAIFFDWSKVVKPGRMKKERFGHHITTDGVSISLNVLLAPPGGFPPKLRDPIRRPKAPPKEEKKTTSKLDEALKQQQVEKERQELLEKMVPSNLAGKLH